MVSDTYPLEWENLEIEAKPGLLNEEKIDTLDIPFVWPNEVDNTDGSDLKIDDLSDIFVNQQELESEPMEINEPEEKYENLNIVKEIPVENKLKIYISALNQLNIDLHNRIATTDFRKLRRIARDFRYRGYTAEATLMRWDAVREGEDKNIFPFQENVDFMFNSSLTYEIAVLKKHVLPQLASINKYSLVYNAAQDLISLLEHVKDIQDEFVPINSILREFTYGSVFKY